MKNRLAILWMTLLLIMVSSVGCSSSNPVLETKNDVETESVVEIQVETVAEMVETGVKTTETAETTEYAEYAVILEGRLSDDEAEMQEAIRQKAEEMRIEVDIYAAQNEGDMEGQLSILRSCVSKGYKGIAIVPLSSTNLIPGVVEASRQGITVISLNEMMDMTELKNQGGVLQGIVTTDNVAVGTKAAGYIASNVEAGSLVAVIEGKAEDTASEARKQGAYSAYEAAGLTVVASVPAEGDYQKAMDTASQLIKDYPDLRGIYCCDDGMALGVLQAVINADKLGQILVVGTDGEAQALESVQEGGMSATVGHDSANIGAKGLELLVEKVKEGRVEGIEMEPEMICIEAELIVKE